MSTKTAILTFALLLLMAAGVVVGIYLVRQNQDVRSHAQTDPSQTTAPAATDAGTTTQGATGTDQSTQNAQAQGGSCTPPAEVTNVRVDYPYCE